MIPLVQKALGTKYPDTPEKLVEANQKVQGPVLAELRTRYNELGPKLGFQHEADAATIEALDTTGMSLFTQMVDEETGDVYSLQTGTPGAGDLQAVPTGFCWVYEYTL